MKKSKGVFIVLHDFKHGFNVDLHSSRKKAEGQVMRLMESRVSSWFRDAAEKFKMMSDFGTKYHFFYETERNISDGHRINIIEREVQ